MHESASSIFGPTFGLALYGGGHALPFDLNAVAPLALVIYGSRHAALRRAGEIA